MPSPRQVFLLQRKKSGIGAGLGKTSGWVHRAATDATPDQILISRELQSAIAQVVRSLPRKLRDPFLLAASGDHRYEEIAAMLGIPLGTVKWRVAEARRMIRLKLDHLGYGDPR